MDICIRDYAEVVEQCQRITNQLFIFNNTILDCEADVNKATYAFIPIKA